ncbi:MAG: carboxypeptidase regulatory-like domain-containing protein, partial [Acidobacteria bacterium]|nr:carboxypeptidase regulatory-like domain-containing protein [Acidobacteriota bacterium]
MTDPSGGVVPGAHVAATAHNGSPVQTRTNGEGHYVLAPLVIGRYQIRRSRCRDSSERSASSSRFTPVLASDLTYSWSSGRWLTWFRCGLQLHCST